MTRDRFPRFRLGSLALGPRPRIVLAVGEPSQEVRRAVRQGAEILEFRVDQAPKLDPQHVLAAAQRLKSYGCPLLLTVRDAREGGAAAMDERGRRELFLAALPVADAVDIELLRARSLSAVIEAAREAGKLVLLSYHDFARTPPLQRLEQLHGRARAAGADLVKFATQVKRRDDLVRLFTFTWKERQRGLVTMGMGREASLSRLLLGLAGSLLVYTSLHPVLGQIPLPRLVQDRNFYFPAHPEK